MKKIKLSTIIILVFVFTLGIVASGLTISYAATTLSSKNVHYDNTNSGGSSTNVSGAIDELYATADDQDLLTAKIIDKIYPIGSIYISTTDSTVDSVEQRFGGTWVRYATDTTLVGYKEGTNTINATGGSKIVTLVESNLPSHNHEISHTHRVSGTANDVDIYGLEYLAEKFLNHTHPIPSLSGSGTTTAAGEHTHNVYRTSGHAASGTNRYTAQGTGDTYKTTAAGNHTHEVTISTKASTTGTCGLILIDTITGIHSHPVDGETITIDNPLSGNTGAGLPVDIQDPYTVVYMYKRTA